MHHLVNMQDDTRKRNIRRVGEVLFGRDPAVSYRANGNERENVPCLLISEAGKQAGCGAFRLQHN